MSIGWVRLTGLFAITLAVAGCESVEEKDRKSKANYAAVTQEACQKAEANILMVSNLQSAMNKKRSTEGLESAAKVFCDEAAKAETAQRQ